MVHPFIVKDDDIGPQLDCFLLPFPLSDDRRPTLQQSLWVLVSIRRSYNHLQYGVALVDAIHIRGTSVQKLRAKAARRRLVEALLQQWLGPENSESTEPKYVHAEVIDCNLGMEAINLGPTLLRDAGWGFNVRQYAETFDAVLYSGIWLNAV